MVTRAQLELSDLIAVFPRPDKQLDPADFYKFCPDNSHPILPPLADFIVNDDSENADAYNDLKPGIQLTIQTVYSWTLYLMMKYGQGMKPCLVHPQFWEPYSIDTENAFNYTIGNRQDFDILFIPILKASHWTLAVWRCGVITYYDSLECPLSGSMVKKIVEIVMTSREGISVHDFQLLRSSPQTDATNCGIFVLINIEQMLRTGEVWVVARLADPMHKYLYINNARMRMRKVLCPKKVKIPETNTWSRRQISKIQHKPVANRNVSKMIRSSFDGLVVRLSRKPSDEWIFKVMEVVSTLQDAALVTGHIVKEVLNSVFFF